VPSPQRVRAASSPGPPRLALETHHAQRSNGRTPSLDHALLPSRISHMPSFSLVGALEFRQVMASLQTDAASSSLSVFDSPVTPYAGGHYHPHHLRGRISTPSREIHPWGPDGLPLSERGSPQIVVSRALSDEDTPHMASDAGDDGDQTVMPSSSSTASDHADSQSTFASQSKRQRALRALSRIFHTVCPSLHQFWEKTLLRKIAAVLAAPAITMLTLTLPVVVLENESGSMAYEKTPPVTGRLIDFEEEGVERPLIADEEVRDDTDEMKYNKWLMATQCLLGPLFCNAILFSEPFSHLLLRHKFDSSLFIRRN
jgi:sodium/potassium/calcium exchanger 6